MDDLKKDTVLLLDAPAADDRDDMSKLADKLTAKACMQMADGIKYRQPKIEKILRGEELYFNKVVKTMQGRFTIPLPIVSGFVDTLLSKIDDEITVNFDHTETADINRARKVSAAWAYDSAPTRGMWGIKDILVKKLALFSGRGIYKIFSEAPYKNHLEIVDAFDFICEPTGGWHLENHMFCGQQNIFRSKTDLQNGSQYDQAQVNKLLSSSTDSTLKQAKDEYLNTQKRQQALNMDPLTNNYIGEDMYNLTEWNMEHEGERYYLFIEPISKIWVRIEKLEAIVGEPEEAEKPRYMFKSWATHYDYWNFWSKAPVDDIVPVAVGLKTLTNFGFDDLQKRLWGQRIFNPEFFPDPSQLEWDRPDKLVMATVPNGRSLGDGIYEFKMGDNSGVVVNMLEYFRNMLATESGITQQTKGASDEKILGIAEINQGEVADRLGLTNKFYAQCHAELGAAYLSGLKMCMTTSRMIRYIGEDGAESAELTKDDLKFSAEPDLRITGGKAEARKNQAIKDSKDAALVNSVKLAPQLFNQKVTIEALLENGGWSQEDISAFMDVNSDGDEQQSIRASQAIQDILNDKTPKLFKGATTRFINKIIDYKEEHELGDAMGATLMSYAMAHQQVVVENMARKATLANLGRVPLNQNGPVPGPNGPVPSTDAPAPGNTAPSAIPVTTA